MRRWIIPLAAGLALLAPAGADARAKRQPAQAARPVDLSQPPKLVVAISIDQFSANLFAQYRQTFRHGLARLMTGAVFPSGFQSHGATETCPGHSTILTGAHPARTGIIANDWFDRSLTRAEKRVYCAEDVTDPASSPDRPVVSARNLLVPTLGEWLKRAGNAGSMNVAVSGKDRAVVMMGGHAIDAGFWWRGDRFETFRGAALAPAVERENAAIAGVLAQDRPAMAMPQPCAARDRAVAVGGGAIGTWRFPVKKGDGDSIKYSPRLDHSVARIALGLAKDMKLGRDDVPDVLSVSFSATDYIGHSWGTEGVEMCIQMAQLDEAVGMLLDGLDAEGIDFVAVLTADHGGMDAAERLREQALPGAGRAAAELAPDRLAKDINDKLHIVTNGPVLLGRSLDGAYFASGSLSTQEKAAVLGELIRRLKANSDVQEIITAEELAQEALPTGPADEWTVRQRLRQSFYPGRSPDVSIVLRPGVSTIADLSERIPGPKGYTATHGSPWDYDRRVPILFWRRGLPGFEQPAPVETVDIAPTLAAVLRLAVPDGAFDGRCLDIDGSAGNGCAAP